MPPFSLCAKPQKSLQAEFTFQTSASHTVRSPDALGELCGGGEKKVEGALEVHVHAPLGALVGLLSFPFPWYGDLVLDLQRKARRQLQV